MTPTPSEADRLAIVRIELNLRQSSWIGVFTQKHPDLLLAIHSTLAVRGDHFIDDIEIFGPPRDWLPEISALPDVTEVSHLDTLPDLGRYRVRYRASSLKNLVVKLEMLLRYPQTVQNGVLSGEVVDRVSRIRRLVESIRSLGFDTRIVSLRQESLMSRKPNLTRVQREIFRQAVAAGYFHVPRRITLTQLAVLVSRSKSSVSETLAVVERKLAESEGIASL